MIIRIKKELVSKVIIFDGRKILLLKRNADSITERSPWPWDLPGGHLDDGEEPEDAAIREVSEETELRINSLIPVGKDSNIGKLTYFYVTEDWSGDIQLSEEHEEYKWVDDAEIHQYKEDIGMMYYKMISQALKTRK